MAQSTKKERTRGHFTAKTQINMTLSLYLCLIEQRYRDSVDLCVLAVKWPLVLSFLVLWAILYPLILKKRFSHLTASHAQRGWFVCLSVCLCVSVSTRILPLQATRRPISDTSGFRTTRAVKTKGRLSWNDCFREICRENKRNRQYA